MKVKLFALLAIVLFSVSCTGISRKMLKQNNNFAIDMASKGYWQEAIFRWSKLEAHHPENPIIQNNLAVAYENLGEIELALIHYKKALELSPDNKVISENYEAFNLRVSSKLPKKNYKDED